ncbi:maleylpyruvate isomerase family mycothiol-dependent enzyme [soil metagenome]
MSEASYDRVALVRGAGHRLAEVGADAPAAAVPRYPGWTVTDLVSHTGRLHRRTIAVVEQRATDRLELSPAPRDGLIEWFADGVDRLAELLETTDPETPCWSFAGEPNVGFWVRRMALETDVHRWDAESAVGVPSPIDTLVAADGIDESYHMWLRAESSDPPDTAGPIAVFDPSDTDGTWTLWATEDGFELRRERSEAPCTVTGPAPDIYLAMLGRLHSPLVEEGNIAAFARWRKAVASMTDAQR